VVTSPDLVREIQRNTKTLSFSPAILPAIRRMLGFDDDGMKLISHKSETEDGFFGEMHRIQKASLGLGTASLEQLNKGVREQLIGFLNHVPDQQTVYLYAWLRRLFTKANTTACFGPLNPFDKYPELEDTFWYVPSRTTYIPARLTPCRDWEENVKILLLGLPKILAPRSYTTAHKTRQKLVDAFLEYLDEGGCDGSASFIKDLYELGARRGLSNENSARALIGSVLAIISNTIPTSFWLLAYVYSRPTLLTAVREEIARTMYRKDSDEVNKVLSLDAAQARDRCPLFVSSYNDKYLLTKGCSIQMPTAFIHEDPASWGADAADFRPDRFLKTKSTREEQTKRATAFRPFGGGNTLCPGRHFAFNEIITFVGTMVMGFDLAPIGGIWKLPEKDRSRMPMSSLKPATDIGLVVSRRKGFEDVRFR
jgi:hypothetical protein